MSSMCCARPLPSATPPAVRRLVFLRAEVGGNAGAVEYPLRAAAAGVTAGDTSPCSGWPPASTRRQTPRQRSCFNGPSTWQHGPPRLCWRPAHAAATKGNGLGLARLAIHRQRAGRRAESEELARAAAAVRHLMALAKLALMYFDTAEWNKAEELLVRAIDMGYVRACTGLVEIREWAGDQAGAEEVRGWAVAAGDTAAVHRLLLREEAGDHAEADGLACRAAAAGDVFALKSLPGVRKGTARSRD